MNENKTKWDRKGRTVFKNNFMICFFKTKVYLRAYNIFNPFFIFSNIFKK